MAGAECDDRQADAGGVYELGELVHWRWIENLVLKRQVDGGCTVKEIAPLLTAKVRTQVANRRLLCEGMFMHAWTNDISGELDTDGLAQFIKLWDILIEVHLRQEEEDRPVWAWNRSGKYSAASAYHMMCEGGIKFQAAAAIWKCWAPLGCKIFIWLAILHRLWTPDRRARHGLQDTTSPCYLCEQEEDTVEHMLMQCVFARQVWHQCFLVAGWSLSMLPTGQDSLQDWRVRSRKRVEKAQRKEFDSFVMLVCWCIWKQRNGRVFGKNDTCNEQGTVRIILRERHLWAIARERGVQTDSE